MQGRSSAAPYHSRPAAPCRHARGWTRIEFLVVVSTVSLLVAFLLPPLLAARELARRTASVDHLRQIGEGFLAHVETYGVLPSNGGLLAETVTTPDIRTINANDDPYRWGYGDPRRAGRMQPGSWAFALLPFIGHEQDFQARNQAVAVECYYIPARRPVKPEVAIDADLIYTGWGCMNDGVNPWGKTDYAGNDQIIRNGVGRGQALSDITDGLACSILSGEKAMDTRAIGKGGWFWDEPLILGGNGGVGRKGDRLLRDGPILEDAADNWGSPYEAGVSFVFADGSARTLGYATSSEIVASLIRPRDGKALPDEWWVCPAPAAKP